MSRQLQRTNKQPKVCVALVNGRRCLNKRCPYSHIDYDIWRWRRQNSEKPCQHGENCFFLSTSNCLFLHTEESRAKVQLWRTERLAAVTRDLVHLENVILEPQSINGKLVSIQGARDLASFNKVSNGEIAVPGSPPRLAPLKQSLSIDRDARNKAINFSMPQYVHPFEPLLRAVELMQPALDMFDGADVISNANNLRRLFDVLSNRAWTTHRFDIELRGETMVLSRWNDDPNLLCSYGHGAGFERATCQYPPDEDPVIQQSASHHRVVAYRFGGLRYVVQSEVDAYYCDCDHSESPESTPPSRPAVSGHKKRHSDPLPSPRKTGVSASPRPLSFPTGAFAALALDDPGDSPSFAAAPPTTTPSPTLRIHRVGRSIPSPCLVEVKTRNVRSIPLSTPEAQLYFSRRTKLYLAEHEKGVFTPGPDLVVRDMTDLEVWEREEQLTLKKLAALLRVVRERVTALKSSGMERVSLVCEGDGTGNDEGVRVRLCQRVGEEGGRLLPEI